MSDYVVLRNEEDLFGNFERGGDVDLLVRNLDIAERTLVRHLGPPVRMMRSSYASGYSWDWGHIDLVQRSEWRGASYLRTQAILDHQRRSDRGRPVPRIAHEALISWFTSLLWGGFFNARYAAIIRKAVETDGDAFRQCLRDAAGKTCGDRLWQAAANGHPESSVNGAASLRRTIWLRTCLRSPWSTFSRALAFVVAEARLRVTPPVPWIAILGSDGSGKSSVVKAVVDRYAACPYAQVKAFHWRPRVIARTRGAEPVTDPHGKPSRGPIRSALRLCVLAADWLTGYWTRLVQLRSKGYILAFDRMYYDLAVDPKRYRYGGGPWLARTWWRLLPKPDLVFLLDSPPEVLWQRKQEVPFAELTRQRDAYTTLVRQLPTGHVLDASLPVEALVDHIQRVVRAWMLDRTMADLSDTIAALAPGVESSNAAPILVSRSDRAS
jgi:thymidylate kinase